MQSSKIDWFRILVDLRDCGLTHCDVAREIGVPRTRVRDWYSQGATPRFDDGALLVTLWLNKCRDFKDGTSYLASIHLMELPRTGR